MLATPKKEVTYYKEAHPAATALYGSGRDEPVCSTVVLDAFISWSACKIKRISSARARTGCGLYDDGEDEAEEDVESESVGER